MSRSRAVTTGLLLLAAAACLLRWHTRAELFYNWDSVQYALGIQRYDLRSHQPHPPGSYYYVLLGRLLTSLTGDPHASLLMMSAVASALTVLVIYALGREAGTAETAWWSASIAASAPLFWFYGSVGLNYAVDGLLAALVGLFCLRLWKGDTRLATALLAGLCLGAAGGVRPTSIVFLAPIWLLGLFTLSRRAKLPALLSVLTAFAVTLGWLLPTVQASGGLRQYLTLNRAMQHTLLSTAAWLVPNPRVALRVAGFTHRRCLESMGGAAWLIALFFLAALARTGWQRPAGGAVPDARETGDKRLPLWLFWSLWIVPAAAFYLLAHFNSPGYSLVYAPAIVTLLALLLTAGTARWATWLRFSTMAAVAVINGGLFWWGMPWAAPTLGQRAISRREIADHDAYWQRLRAYLLKHHPPGSGRVIVAGTSTDGLRPADALLPEHAGDLCQVSDPDPRRGMPWELARLPFLRFCSIPEVLNDPVPSVAVLRTEEDARYHRGCFQERGGVITRREIGGGHVVGIISGEGRR